MGYMSTKFGVDSSSRFPFIARTHTQTHTKSQTLLIAHPTTASYNEIQMHTVVTSAEEGGYVFGSVCLSVCLSACRITRKLVNGF